MSKYIIELNEDCKIVQQMCVTEHGNAYTDGCYSCYLEELNSDYINEHFGELQDEAYQAGLNDAWEAARKIVTDTDHGGLASRTLCEIFDTRSYSYIMRENTAQEAIDKIKAYDDSKHSDRIEVGDEVEAAFGTAVVTYCEEETVGYLYSTGTTGFDEPRNVKKTGRHFDIASILEAMRQ